MVNLESVVKTPDSLFADIVDFDFKGHYLDNLPGYEGLRIHYIDAGPRNAREVFLCLHGNPTWSYLYRKMMKQIVDKGFRVVAPDLIGFGKSDKLTDASLYNFDFYRNMLIEFIRNVNLKNITLVCQDLGGLLGLTLPYDLPHSFSRIIAMNTTLATGDFPLSKGFLQWRDFCNQNPDLDVAALMRRSCPHLRDQELTAYSTPFADENSKVAIRALANMVPDGPEAPGARVSLKAKKWLMSKWEGESFLACGMKDPVLGPERMFALKECIKNAPAPYKMAEAGHFVPEWGQEVLKKAFEHFSL